MLHGMEYQELIKKIQETLGVCSSAVTLGEGRSSPRDIWQQLETFVVVTTRGAPGIEGVEARDVAQHPTVPRKPPPNRECPEVENSDTFNKKFKVHRTL